MNSSYSWGIYDFSTFLLQFTIAANANNSNYGSVSGGGYYEAGDMVALTATAETGYVFVNWIEGSTEVSTLSSYNFTANSNRQLTANFEIDHTPPTTLNIDNQTFTSGSDTCFNATQNIVVANNGNAVEFESGAYATFIAGQSISFMPGFHAKNGSTISAYITTNSAFCNDLPIAIMATEPIAEKSIYVSENKTSENKQLQMKIYPNPNYGRFTVELLNFDREVQLFVFNSMGAVIQKAIVNGDQTSLDLSTKQRGIYFVKAFDGEKQLTQKVIIQ